MKFGSLNHRGVDCYITKAIQANPLSSSYTQAAAEWTKSICGWWSSSLKKRNNNSNNKRVQIHLKVPQNAQLLPYLGFESEKNRISMQVLSQRLVSRRCLISALHQSNTRVSPQHQKQLIPTRTSLLLWETCHLQRKVVLITITVIQELTFYKNKSCYNIRHFLNVPCGKKQTLVAIGTRESGPAKDHGQSSGSSMKIKRTPLKTFASKPDTEQQSPKRSADMKDWECK